MKKHKQSIMLLLLMGFVIFGISLSAVTTIHKINSDIEILSLKNDKLITVISESISNDAQTLEAVKTNQTPSTLVKYYESVLEANSEIDLIVVANAQGKRVYHPIPDFIGQSFVGDDQRRVLNGAQTYITETVGGTDKLQRRAFTAIKDGDGKTQGFVMVASYAVTLSDMKQHIIQTTFMSFSTLMLLGLLFAYLIGKRIKKQLLGHEPQAFAKHYIQQSNVLDALHEGVMLLDSNQELLYANKAARYVMMYVMGDDTTQSQKVFIKEHLDGVLRRMSSHRRSELCVKDLNLLVKTLPSTSTRNKEQIIIIENRSDLTKMASELTGINHLLHALRASTHEHKNKMHTIMGLIQLQEYDAVKAYVTSVESEYNEALLPLLNRIENRTIGALILGKINEGKERGIQITLDPDSSLQKHNPYLSTRNITIIVGNLIENAMRAVEDVDQAKVEVLIQARPECLWIQVEDNGHGIEEKDIDYIFELGYSTNGTGRGMGLNLIHGIVDDRNGIITVDSEVNVGTLVGIQLSKKRRRFKEESTLENNNRG